MKLSGIYKISNKINNKIYIGSSKDILDRWADHKKELRHNYHGNPHLQNSWNKYKEESFRFEILELTPLELLLVREQEWLDSSGCCDKKIGYNCSKIAGNPPTRNHSDESKKYLSEINSGENNAFFGKNHSQETKNKMKESWTLRKSNVDYISPLLGFKHSEETKRKNSESKKGKYCGDKSVNAKLTWNLVKQIRQDYIPFKNGAHKLAKKYNVTKPTILAIIHNKTWFDANYRVGEK